MLKIDVFEKNGRWLWRIYSRKKFIAPNLCACIAHGTGKTKEVAEARALKVMGEILNEERGEKNEESR